MDESADFFDSLQLLSRLESGEDESPYAGMLRLMCDNVPDLLWAKDLNRRYLFVNQAICDKLLCASDTREPIGKNDMFFAERERAAHPEEAEWHTFGEICRDSDSIVMESGVPGRFDEFGNVRGEFLFLDVYKAPFRDRAGTIIGTVGCGRVVTDERRMVEALREREAEYRKIVDEAASVIVKTDLSGQVLFMNRYGLELFGYTMEELYRKKAEGIGVSGMPAIEECVTRDGERIWISWTGRRLCDSEGRCYGFLSIGNDVSNYKIREKELQEARERAESAETRKGLFVGTVTHELRTPLSGMIGVVDSILSRTRGRKVHEEVELVRDAAQTLLALVDDLVNFSEVTSGRELLHCRRFRLRKDVVGPVVRLMEPLARGKGLLLDAHTDRNIPELLEGDPLRIRQVLFNLLGNAVKYTERGRISFSVELDSPLFPEAGELPLLFTVADTGSGIPDDVRGSLFDMFSRSGSADRYGLTGNGVGLAVVKNLVDAMGGRIEVESGPAYGSIFRVRIGLPVISDAPVDASPADSGGERDLGALRDRKPLLLLVDDNKLHRLSIGWSLRDAGCRVAEAAGRSEALAHFMEEPPDAVIIDVRMPDVQGPDLLDELRRARPGKRVFIAVTAWAGASERETLLKAGFSAVLIKPVVREQLNNLLAELLYGVGREETEGDLSRTVEDFAGKVGLAAERDGAYLRQMASLFIEDIPHLLENFEHGLGSCPGRTDKLRETVHSLCNYVGVLGGTTLAERLRALEEQLAAGVCGADRLREAAGEVAELHRLLKDRFPPGSRFE